jgi:3-hydroxymyristoyl/3-hydroxydecanoyl-(acyl carrier protein) dehydratase
LRGIPSRHIINCSILPGEGIVEALAQTAQATDFPYGSERGLCRLDLAERPGRDKAKHEAGVLARDVDGGGGVGGSILPGEGIVEALAQTAQATDFPYGSERGLLILAGPARAPL